MIARDQPLEAVPLEHDTVSRIHDASASLKGIGIEPFINGRIALKFNGMGIDVD